MSKKVKFSEKEITEAFETALEKGEVTDVIGNPIEVSEMVEEHFYGDENEPLKDIPYHNALNVLKGAQGKVLTIVDATFTDEKRLKYVKDLIKDTFSSQANWLFELAIRDIEPVEIKEKKA